MRASITDAVFLSGYLCPLFVLVAAGPLVLRRHGMTGLVALGLTASLCTALILTVVGKQQAAADGSPPVVGASAVTFAVVLFVVLLLGPMLALIVQARRGGTLREQRVVAFAVGFTIQVLATPVYLFGVGCAAGMGCIGM